MKIIYTIIKIVILLAFILLAVSNTHMTAFYYLPGQSVRLPLIVLLLVFFVVGTVFGVLSLFGRLLTLRSEISRLRGELSQSARVVLRDTHGRQGEVSAPASADGAATEQSVHKS